MCGEFINGKQLVLKVIYGRYLRFWKRPNNIYLFFENNSMSCTVDVAFNPQVVQWSNLLALIG